MSADDKDYTEQEKLSLDKFDKREIHPHDGYSFEDYSDITFMEFGEKDPPGGVQRSFSGESDYGESGTYDEKAVLALDFCGYEHCIPGHSFGPLARSIYIVHAVISGRGTLMYHKRRYEIGAGRLFLLPPGEVTTYMADDRDPWYYCWIAFHGTAAPRCISEIGFTAENPVVIVRDTDRIERLIHDLLPHFGRSIEERLIRSSILRAAIAEMIGQSVVQVESRFAEEQFSYAEYAANFIRAHYHEKIKISDLAEHIGISRSYLVSVMKRTMGRSPKEYLTTIRMTHAGHYLSHTEDSIREVAVECGYSDPLAFTKAFKLYFGMSPSRYREIHRDRHIPEDQTEEIN